MARWRLLAAHYLNTNPATEWEYKETDRNTGRQARKVFPVPRLIDPKDPADWNDGSEVVVSNGVGAMPRDVVFLGEPTPDMEPLDDDARKVSASLEHKWLKRPDHLDGVDYSQSIIVELTRQITDLASAKPMPMAVPNTAVDPAAFAKMQEQVALLLARNEELEEKVARTRRG